MRLNFSGVVSFLAIAILVDMVIGGLFSCSVDDLVPRFFSQVVFWDSVQPVGATIALGAILEGGLLGRELGVFETIIQLIFVLLQSN